MKRLHLEDFKAKHTIPSTEQTDQLLGQVLGNCHDQPDDCNDNSSNDNSSDTSVAGEVLSAAWDLTMTVVRAVAL